MFFIFALLLQKEYPLCPGNRSLYHLIYMYIFFVRNPKQSFCTCKTTCNSSSNRLLLQNQYTLFLDNGFRMYVCIKTMLPLKIYSNRKKLIIGDWICIGFSNLNLNDKKFLRLRYDEFTRKKIAYDQNSQLHLKKKCLNTVTTLS